MVQQSREDGVGRIKSRPIAYRATFGGLEATAALEAEVWVETITEGGRRFMVAWREVEVDAARHRQVEREATRLGSKVVIAHDSVKCCEATPIGLVDEPMKSCTGARRTETGVAPRHVGASRDFILFSPNEQCWGWGGGGGEWALPDFFFSLYFPCSADPERDWPSLCNHDHVDFSGWQPND